MEGTWLGFRGLHSSSCVRVSCPDTKRGCNRTFGVTCMENKSRPDSAGEKSVRDLPPRGVQQGQVIGADFTPVGERARPVRGTRLPRRRILKDDVAGTEGGPSTSGTADPRPRAPPGAQKKADILDNLSNEELTRKSAVLLSILTSGLQVEEQIRKHRQEIDEVLVALLDRRLRAAARVGEERAVVEGLGMMLRRLKLEAAKQAATPAQRVLDDALRIMHPSNTAEYDEKIEAVQDRLVQSFRARADPWDIIGAASMLAKGAEVAEETDDVPDVVIKEQFIVETSRLLKTAKAQQDELQTSLRQGGVGARQAATIEGFLRERALLIVHLQEILNVAKSIRA